MDRGDAMARLEALVIGADFGPDWLSGLQARFPDLRISQGRGLEEYGPALAEADAYCGWQLSPAALAAAPNLRWVQAITAGVDSFLYPELLERGILLTNMSGVHASNISEHVLALILGFARNLPELRDAQGRGEWKQVVNRQFELTGQTLCIVGLGDIGLALAAKAAALGMRVSGVRNRPLPAHGIGTVATPDTMRPLLAEADHVALCMPLTPGSRNLFNAERLSWIKPGAYLYNIGRGETLDQDALLAALRSGHLRGAGLDVTTPEPLPAEHPFWRMPNVVITAHTSGASPLLWGRMRDLLADNIARYRAGQPLRNVVDPTLGY
ncbi:MAG: D-2-hydroxyacid dehydrogenase [Chloroflexi bacterium]|nr:MAG: D-2-hydroxyacid dehydrogenase [Chloroflexota bacterium]